MVVLHVCDGYPASVWETNVKVSIICCNVREGETRTDRRMVPLPKGKSDFEKVLISYFLSHYTFIQIVLLSQFNKVINVSGRCVQSCPSESKFSILGLGNSSRICHLYGDWFVKVGQGILIEIAFKWFLEEMSNVSASGPIIISNISKLKSVRIFWSLIKSNSLGLQTAFY